MPDEPPRAVSAFVCAWLSYAFLFRRFVPLLKVAGLPIAAMGAVVYLSLNAYLSELMQFIASGDPRAASLALAALAAGIFISIFCVAVAVSGVTHLALESPSRMSWSSPKAGRREWR